MTGLPVILVAGLGRCGTTMVMNMLAAAGVPCVGPAPAYEVDEVNHRPPSYDWLRAQQGKALKLLNPHCSAPLPPCPSVVIWLDRDRIEQARSHAKFVHLVAGAPAADRRHVRAMAKGLERDRGLALLALPGRRTLRLSFEELLDDPRNAAHRLHAFLYPDFGALDVSAMAAVVRRRSPKCAADLSIEIEMLEAARV